MIIHLFHRDPAEHGGAAEQEPVTYEDVVRTETYLYHEPTEDRYQVMLLDAPDSFDVVIGLPDGTREIVWSLVKD